MKTPAEVAAHYFENFNPVSAARCEEALTQDRIDHVKEIRAAIASVVCESNVPDHALGMKYAQKRILALPELQLPEPEPESWMNHAAHDIANSGTLSRNDLAAIISRHYRANV